MHFAIFTTTTKKIVNQMIKNSKIQIKLINWHCFNSQEFVLPWKSLMIKDKNGAGKTSLLSAIYSLFTGNPWPKTKFKEANTFNSQYFGIQALNNNWYIAGKYTSNNRFLTENVFPETLSCLPNVNFQNIKVLTYTPNDNNWFLYSRDERLSILDDLLGQIYGLEYIKILQYLNKLVLNKQKILKRIEKTRQQDDILLSTTSVQIAKYSTAIWKYRFEFVKILNANLDEFSTWINSDLKDIKAKITTYNIHGIKCLKLVYDYNTLINTDYQNVNWSELVKKESIIQRTMFGAHKDDFMITANGLDIVQILSRGEMRMLVLFIKAIARRSLSKNNYVIWLLDDIFNEFDEVREQKVFSKILKKTDIFMVTGTKKTKLDIPVYSIKQLAVKL